MSTEGQLSRSSSAHKWEVNTEEQWAPRNSEHTGTVGIRIASTEEEWAQRNSSHRGTVGTEEQRAQMNNKHKGTVGTEDR